MGSNNMFTSAKNLFTTFYKSVKIAKERIINYKLK